MKTIINENKEDIGTAVFYGWHKFIPKTDILDSDKELLLNSCKSLKVQYKGSRTYASLRDFSEYNFLFDINKEKFNDNFLINLLNKNSKDLIGKNIDDLEIIEKIMFPCYNLEESDYNDEFFGSTLISNQTFFILNAEGNTKEKPGIWKIELYEEGVTSNNINGGFIEEELLDALGIEKTETPVITIILGPGPEIKNNSSSMYFSYDPQLIDKENNDRLSLVDYRKLSEEITMSKVVWILLALDKTVTSINLSYKSWVDNINPNRNMKNYIIRNDEFFSTKDRVKIIEKFKNSNYWHDKNSETLVGNKEITNHPILDKKLEKIKNNSQFSPFTEYNIGDQVTFGGETWESLCSHNKGNSPSISNYWTLASNITSIFTYRVSILIYPSNSGFSDPSGSITINEDSRISFNIFETPGYLIDEENPCSYEIGHPIDDYILTINRDPLIGNEVTLTINNWNNLITSGKLYINFKKVYSTITLNMSDGSTVVNYDKWIDQFSDQTLILKKVKINGVEKDPEFNENYQLSYYIDDEISLIFPDFLKYTIESVNSTYIIDNVPKTKIILPETIENSEGETEVVLKDKVDYTSTIYTLNIVPKILTVKVIESEGFEISSIIGRVVYGNNYNLSFYGETFTELIIKSKKESISFTDEDLEKVISIENTILILKKDSSNGNYSLEMTNIETNFEISLKS